MDFVFNKSFDLCLCVKISTFRDTVRLEIFQIRNKDIYAHLPAFLRGYAVNAAFQAVFAIRMHQSNSDERQRGTTDIQIRLNI